MVLKVNKLEGGVGIMTMFSGPKMFYSAQAIRHREILYGIFKERSVLFSGKYSTCSDNVF
jgi:hypothetical protein